MKRIKRNGERGTFRALIELGQIGHVPAATESFDQ